MSECLFSAVVLYAVFHDTNFYLRNILNVVLISSLYYVRANRTSCKEDDDETVLKELRI